MKWCLTLIFWGSFGWAASRDPFMPPKNLIPMLKSNPKVLEQTKPKSSTEMPQLNDAKQETLPVPDSGQGVSEIEMVELADIKFTARIQTQQGSERILARIKGKTVTLKPGDKVGKEGGILRGSDGQKVTIELPDTNPDNKGGKKRNLLFIPMGGS